MGGVEEAAAWLGPHTFITLRLVVDAFGLEAASIPGSNCASSYRWAQIFGFGEEGVIWLPGLLPKVKFSVHTIMKPYRRWEDND